VEGGVVDLCNFNPGYDLDLLVKSSLRSMTAIWMGLTTIKKESDGGLLEIEGDPALARSMQQWLGLSAFAH
ncbi:MAG: transcriptional regulator, partial [Mesorhizobium sp.]